MPRRRWVALGARVARLLLRPPRRTAELVRQSYDRVACGYDQAWTDHMRGFSDELLARLAPWHGAECLDLTCGTGHVTNELARQTDTRVQGVDASAGMLAQARAQFGTRCTFIQADATDYLHTCPRHSFDIITCAWGLGYTHPWRIIRAAARVLRPGGKLGIIDNSLFSLAGVLWTSVLAFAEQPHTLVHAMQVRFLPGSWCLTLLMRAAGLAVLSAWDGAKTYRVPTGDAAIARLTATGAAAGFEFAADEHHRAAIFARFAHLLEERCHGDAGIPVTHRYLAAVGQKR